MRGVEQRMKGGVTMTLALALVAVAGCSAEAELPTLDARPPADAATDAAHDGMHGATPDGEATGSMEASTPSGARVQVTLPDPLLPGPGTFRLTLPDGVDPEIVTADLVSPTMPMHGVLRGQPEVTDEGVVLSLEIPMEGSWALYVNLDGAGADAAEFLFEVPPHPGAAPSGHSMAQPSHNAEVM